MVDENETTTIVVRKTTRDKLAQIGTKDDTFDEIITRLCDFWARYGGVVKSAR